MNSIIYDLYNGDIYPGQNITPTSPRYKKLNQVILDEKTALQEKLDEKHSERLERLGEMYIELSEIYGYENFLCGIKLGTQLMIELLRDGDLPEFQRVEETL